MYRQDDAARHNPKNLPPTAHTKTAAPPHLGGEAGWAEGCPVMIPVATGKPLSSALYDSRYPSQNLRAGVR